jgi:hypothetical protein
VSLDIELVASVDTGGAEPFTAHIHEQNITHNVSPMWREAGVYEALYESHGRRAGDFLPALRAGVGIMRSNPSRFTRLNPSNGWGSYDTALPWLEAWLRACEEHPKATIRVSA